MRKCFISILFFIFIFTVSGSAENYNYFGNNGYRQTEIYQEIIPPYQQEVLKKFVSDKIIYGSINGFLYAIQAGSGKVLWRFPIGKSPYRQNFKVFKNNVYIGRGDKWAFALNAVTGEVVWKRFLNEPFFSTPLPLKDSVIFAGDDVNTFFVDPVNGDVKKRLYSMGSGYTPVYRNNFLLLTGFRKVMVYKQEADKLRFIWQKKFDENFDTHPYMNGKFVLVTTSAGKIYSLNTEDGSSLWSFETHGNIISSPINYKNRVYVGSTDGNVYCLDEKNGKKIFEFPAGKAIIGNIAARDNSIYFASRNGKLFCIDSDKNFLKWEYFFGSRIINELYFIGDVLVLNAPDKCVTALSTISGSVHWKLETGIKYSETTAEGDALFFTSTREKTVISYSIEKRKILWKKILPEPPYFKPRILSRYLVVFGANHVYFLNKTNGELLFSRQAVVNVREPVITDNTVFGFDGSKVYRFNISFNKMDWIFPINGNILKGITLSNGILYFGTSEGKIFALNSQNGIKQFEIDVKSQITAAPVVSENVLYIGAYNGNLYAFNAMSGAEIWKFNTFGEITTSPAIAGSDLYFVSRGHYLYSLNKKDGKKIWSTAIQTRFNMNPIIFGNYVIASGVSDILYFLYRPNGEIRGEFFSGSAVEGGVSIHNGYIIFTVKSGSIYILKKK